MAKTQIKQPRYAKGELIRAPWPKLCPDCKGEPVQLVRGGDPMPFTGHLVAMVPDRHGNESEYDVYNLVRCELCCGTGTVIVP